MKQIKIVMGSIMLLFFTAAVSQTKIPTPPPVPEVKAEKAIEQQNVMKPEVNYPAKTPMSPPPPPPAPVIRHNIPAPPPTNIIGYPATRNGKDVWVMKPRPIKPAIPPPPPPPLPPLPKKDQ